MEQSSAFALTHRPISIPYSNSLQSQLARFDNFNHNSGQSLGTLTSRQARLSGLHTSNFRLHHYPIPPANHNHSSSRVVKATCGISDTMKTNTPNQKRVLLKIRSNRWPPISVSSRCLALLPTSYSDSPIIAIETYSQYLEAQSQQRPFPWNSPLH